MSRSGQRASTSPPIRYQGALTPAVDFARLAGEHACLTISDDGPGIGAELLPRLGQPFVTASEGGTGLGVLLAESVVRQHGGALRFESEPGRGVRATLELPFGMGHARAERS